MTASSTTTTGNCPKDDRYVDATGVELGAALDAGRLRRALCAGRHRELSELGADERLPAKVAGVQRIVMVVPTPKGALNPLVLVAA